jgi:hypothetical protein
VISLWKRGSPAPPLIGRCHVSDEHDTSIKTPLISEMLVDYANGHRDAVITITNANAGLSKGKEMVRGSGVGGSGFGGGDSLNNNNTGIK